MGCEGRESVPSAGLLQRKPWLQKENSEAGTIRCQMPWLAAPSEEEAGGREALRTQSPWRREGKPVLVDRLDFWKRLLSIMLEQEEVAVGGPEGRREGQSGRIRPQLASQMGTGGGAPDGTDAASTGVYFPLRPRRVWGWVSISSDVWKECSNVGIRKDSLKAFLGSMWWDYPEFDANLGFWVI